LKNITDYSML